MITQMERWDLSNMLQPVQDPEDARQDAMAFGANLTVLAGTAVAVKTSDKKTYPMVPGASDGTQNFVGFSMYSFVTDANGQAYLGTSITASPNYRQSPWSTMAVWVSGIFDPQDVQTVGGIAAEVDTFTPATVTTGDVNRITYVNPTTGAVTSVTFTVGGTQTAAAVVTGLTAAWNADATLAALGTASGSTTFIVTAKTAGVPLNLFSTVDSGGTGTLTRALTTSPGAPIGEIDAFTPANVTTGDVNTLTFAGGPGAPQVVTFTVGATQTATAAINGLLAAWNANATTSALGYAANNNNTSLSIVSKVPGVPLNLTSSVPGGTGTLTKATRVAASGRSIADIQVARPGAYVQHNGFWAIK